MSGLFQPPFSALWDVLLVALVLFAFQYLVLRRPFPRAGRVAAGFGYMLVGLILLVLGLEMAVFPLGEIMTGQILERSGAGSALSLMLGIGAFAAAVTFAAVFAEPVLTSLSGRAQQVSGGTIDAVRMRLVVASGATIGVGLGVLRIVWGWHVSHLVAPFIVVIWIQSRYAPPVIRPLAYDAGVAGVSTILVPLLISIGAALAMEIPGRSVLADGFGLVVMAALTPVAMVMGYAQIAGYLAGRREEN